MSLIYGDTQRIDLKKYFIKLRKIEKMIITVFKKKKKKTKN